MGAEIWGAIGVIVGGLLTLIGIRWQLPKIRADARKSNAEASHLEWSTLRDEINRLTFRVETQETNIANLRKELASVRETAADEKTELENENKSLKAEVRRLKRRVSALEEVFKVEPPTPEQQALLDQLKEIE